MYQLINKAQQGKTSAEQRPCSIESQCSMKAYLVFY